LYIPAAALRSLIPFRKGASVWFLFYFKEALIESECINKKIEKKE
jgi:hypothetical protein